MLEKNHDSQKTLRLILDAKKMNSAQTRRQMSLIIGELVKHPNITKNKKWDFPPELFQEGFNEGLSTLTFQNICDFLDVLESGGIETSTLNSEKIIGLLVRRLNTIIRNKTIDLWRKETFPVDAQELNQEWCNG